MSEKTITVNGKKLTRADAEALVNSLFGEDETAKEIERLESEHNAECEFKSHILDCLIEKSREYDADSGYLFGYLDCCAEVFGYDDEDFDIPFFGNDGCDGCENLKDGACNCEGSCADCEDNK